MRSEWVNHDGSGCPAELDKHHRVDIKSDTGSVYSVRADKVNWKNITAWRISYDGLYSPPKQVSDETPPPARPSPDSGPPPVADTPSTYTDTFGVGVKIHQAHEQALKDNQEAEPVNPCKCVDCGGTEPSHSNDCEYMNAFYKSPSVQDTLEQRGSRYGDFTDNAMISQQLKQLIMCESDGKLRDGYRRCSFVQREALEMIAQKIARILNGDPNYKDNWHDIQGYARLAEERCKE